MIIPQRKTIFDHMKTKIDSFDDISQEKIPNNLWLIFLIILVVLLFILPYFSISISISATNNLKKQIQQKEIMIEKIQE